MLVAVCCMLVETASSVTVVVEGGCAEAVEGAECGVLEA